MKNVIIDGQMHKSDYEGWLADNPEDATEAESPYQAMTEENIKTCGVR